MKEDGTRMAVGERRSIISTQRLSLRATPLTISKMLSFCYRMMIWLDSGLILRIHYHCRLKMPIILFKLDLLWLQTDN